MTGLTLAMALWSTSARADDPAEGVPGFVCYGESESVMAGASLAEMRAERDKRLADLRSGTIPPHRMAHSHCVLASIMRRIGDARARTHYRRAIALDPDQPAYELWYAQYLQWTRGASGPLTAQAERHNLAALAKNEGFHEAGQTGDLHDVIDDWAFKDLSWLYIEDGVPLLPGRAKARPYVGTRPGAPQLFAAASAEVAVDTVDFWDFSDVRRFTAEALTVQDRTFALGGIEESDVRAIPRAPMRYELFGRLRLRQNALGAIDAFVRRAELIDSQITLFADPTQTNDVKVEEAGVGYRRAFSLGTVLDVRFEAQGVLQDRFGIVEGDPEEREDVAYYNLALSVSRFFGPTKVTLGGAYVSFDMEDLPVGALDAVPRARVVRTAFADVASYRPVVFPQLERGTFAAKRMRTRGLHLFGAWFEDRESFGLDLITKTNTTWGLVYKGLSRGWWDVMALGDVYTYRRSIYGEPLDTFTNDQIRTTLRVTRRLRDHDRNPGLPTQPGLWSANLVVPLRWDQALRGPNDYENVRGTVELWTLWYSKPTRGSSILVNAGFGAEHFYHLDQTYLIGNVAIRVGWPTLGILPAFQ